MRRFIRYLAFGAVIAAPFASRADTTVTLQFGGRARSYVLHSPAGYKPSTAYPLMLVDHGEYGSGAQMEATTHFDDIADGGGFFVAYPNAAGAAWVLSGPMNDVDFHQAVVASVESAYRIDPSRIYISGYSDGGQMAHAYACSRPAGGAVAGIGIVANDITLHAAMRCSSQPPIAHISFHGTADAFSLYDGRGRQPSAPQTALLWARHDGCTGNARTSEQPDQLSNGAPTTDQEQAWLSCADGRSVTFYTINGGGHTWPGSIRHVQLPVPVTGPVSLDLDASLLIWQTLSSFSASPAG